MKTIYIGSFTRLYDEEGIARSFEHLGHEVVRYEERGFGHKEFDEIIKSDADLLVFAKLKIHPPLRADLVSKFKGKTICYVPDLYFGLSREHLVWNDPIFRADYVFTPDGGNDEKWKTYGVNHHCVRQGIFHEEVGKVSVNKRIDVVFVGALNEQFPYRHKLIEFLRDNYDLKWFGNGSDDEVRGEDLTILYNKTRIVIGDSVSSPKYWSNRIYETIGRGGFIIHPIIEGLEEDYEPYKHFIPYNYGDFEGLKKKIDHYLTNPEECRQISEAGMKHTLENHTLLNRCQQILKIING